MGLMDKGFQTMVYTAITENEGIKDAIYRLFEEWHKKKHKEEKDGKENKTTEK